jgi:hypothetical protein
LDRFGGLEILIQGNKPFSDENWDTLISNLKADFKRIGPEKSRIYNDLHKRKVFINPFKRLENVIEGLRKRMEEIDLTKPATDKSFQDEGFQKWIQNISEAKMIGTSLMALIPVWGESFVNLVFFLLRKKKIISDERICDFFVKQDIDVRIKTLHLFCNGFKEGIDFDKNEFKDFKSLMAKRNDFLHGNIKPSQLKVEEIMYDEKIPIFRDERGFLIRIIDNSLHQIRKEDVFNNYETIKKFIEFILSYLEKQSEKQVISSLNKLHLGFEGEEVFPPELGSVEYIMFL